MKMNKMIAKMNGFMPMVNKEMKELGYIDEPFLYQINDDVFVNAKEDGTKTQMLIIINNDFYNNVVLSLVGFTVDEDECDYNMDLIERAEVSEQGLKDLVARLEEIIKADGYKVKENA